MTLRTQTRYVISRYTIGMIIMSDFWNYPCNLYKVDQFSFTVMYAYYSLLAISNILKRMTYQAVIFD